MYINSTQIELGFLASSFPDMVLLRHVLALAGLVVSVTASASRPAPDHRRRGSIRRDGSLDGTLIDSNSTVIHGVFMVELHGGISAADLENELKAEGITIQTRRVFDSKLFKGVSFDVWTPASTRTQRQPPYRPPML